MYLMFHNYHFNNIIMKHKIYKSENKKNNFKLLVKYVLICFVTHIESSNQIIINQIINWKKIVTKNEKYINIC